ncbi:hypothetical protein ACHAPI_004639 [Fusarium lateritium]
MKYDVSLEKAHLDGVAKARAAVSPAAISLLGLCIYKSVACASGRELIKAINAVDSQGAKHIRGRSKLLSKCANN